MGKYVDMANEVMGIKPDNRGRWVVFDSPLFGRCWGRLKEVVGATYILTDHDVVKGDVRIPEAWMVRIVDEQPVRKKRMRRNKCHLVEREKLGDFQGESANNIIKGTR